MKKRKEPARCKDANAAKEGLAERNGSLGEKKIRGEKHRAKTGGKQKWRTAVK